MATDNPFRPYKVVAQSGTSLQLKAGTNVRLIRVVFLLAPLILLGMGVVLFVMQSDPKFLYILGGAALLETVIFSFIKTPGDLQMDRMGFTLQTVSLRGVQQTDYLWSDADRIRQRIIRSKNGATLNYQAVMKSGQKVSFLSFPNYIAKKGEAPQVAETLRSISGKEVTDK